ncbi:hypothetical protein [Ruania halotolerans]|nr:hypothetical protein [Ruania halotolerans]
MRRYARRVDEIEKIVDSTTGDIVIYRSLAVIHAPQPARARR